ncbi:hypothetical protein, partial [Pectobacterium aquaticum]
EAAQSVAGRGVVGGRSESEKAASGQTGQGLDGEAAGAEPDTVIKGKKKAAKTSLPASTEMLINDMVEGSDNRSGLE